MKKAIKIHPLKKLLKKSELHSFFINIPMGFGLKPLIKKQIEILKDYEANICHNKRFDEIMADIDKKSTPLNVYEYEWNEIKWEMKSYETPFFLFQKFVWNFERVRNQDPFKIIILIFQNCIDNRYHELLQEYSTDFNKYSIFSYKFDLLAHIIKKE